MPSHMAWAALCALSMLAPTVVAAEPLIYEGRLTDTDGVPAQADVIAFAIYDIADGLDAEPIWRSVESPLLADVDGRFIATIDAGAAGPLDAAHFAGSRWLEVIVDGVPLSPRQRIGTVPRSIAAADAAARQQLPNRPRGLSPLNPASSCSDALASGIERSGVVWVLPPLPDRVDDPLPGFGEPREVYCDQVTLGGGWALIYNSVIGVDTTLFWRIPYAERLGRFGRPSLDSNFYDGLLYLAGHGDEQANEYIDVVEDLRGQAAVAAHGEAHGFLDGLMAFERPAFLEGVERWFIVHFAGGWSSAGRDLDLEDGANCAERYEGVTQHYRDCWVMNLGADARPEIIDGYVGPHVNSGLLSEDLGLAVEEGGGNHSRVRRISRLVRW